MDWNPAFLAERCPSQREGSPKEGETSVLTQKFVEIYSALATGRVLPPITPTVLAELRAAGAPVGVTRLKGLTEFWFEWEGGFLMSDVGLENRVCAVDN